jgi:hypothetical protein
MSLSFGSVRGALNTPPRFNATFQVNQKVLRFSAPTAATTNAPDTISTTDLFNLLLVMITNSTAAPIIAALRLRRVSMWVCPTTTGVPAYGSIEFALSNTPGNTGVKPTVFSDTSMSSATPAFVTAKPQRGSATATWQNRPGNTPTGGAGFQLIHSAQAIIDVTMDIILQNGETPPSLLSTTPSSGFTAQGQVFVNTLDFTTNNQIVPDPTQS